MGKKDWKRLMDDVQLGLRISALKLPLTFNSCFSLVTLAVPLNAPGLCYRGITQTA